MILFLQLKKKFNLIYDFIFIIKKKNIKFNLKHDKIK